MWSQVIAIGWAQFRVIRNHLPRTSWGSILLTCLTLLWYGIYFGAGALLAVTIPRLSAADLNLWVPVGLLSVFLFWQLIPLFTLSAGWSLQLNKLQIYPVPYSALFAIEVLLRLTTAPEMLLVLLGGMIGLLRHASFHSLSPLCLLLFIPLNLLLSLAVRELVLHSFERNRFRELFAIFIISIGVLPQLVLRTGLGKQMTPYLLAAAGNRFTPWRQIADLALGRVSLWDISFCCIWLSLSYFIAGRLFARSLTFEETLRSGNVTRGSSDSGTAGLAAQFADLLARPLNDPLGALVRKELQSLFRMPRFRVIFGMACVFSVVIFIPVAMHASSRGGGQFIDSNFFSVVTLYGLLLLSDALLLNAFGTDRAAAQLYFVAPVPLRTVLVAKNVAAVVIIGLQSVLVLLFVALLRFPLTWLNVFNSLTAVMVVTVFFFSAGNFSSVAMARAADPRQTFRKQAGGRMQLWLLLCTLGMLLLVGLALLAKWALDADWAFLAVLAVELPVGAAVYWVSLESAVNRGIRDREKMIEALSKGPAPIGFGS